MFNENVLKGKWTEIKGDIQKQWAKLTDDDLDKAKGDLKSLAGVIQQKYGLAQDEARKKIDDFLAHFGKSDAVEKKSLDEQALDDVASDSEDFEKH